MELLQRCSLTAPYPVPFTLFIYKIKVLSSFLSVQPPVRLTTTLVVHLPPVFALHLLFQHTLSSVVSQRIQGGAHKRSPTVQRSQRLQGNISRQQGEEVRNKVEGREGS